MASYRALHTYGNGILHQLMDGAQPQHALGAPAYALEALREVGLVKRRMLRSGAVATAYWFLSGDVGPAPPKSCNDPGLFDGLPED